jgi:hypothetical protein
MKDYGTAKYYSKPVKDAVTSIIAYSNKILELTTKYEKLHDSEDPNEYEKDFEICEEINQYKDLIHIALADINFDS